MRDICFVKEELFRFRRRSGTQAPRPGPGAYSGNQDIPTFANCLLTAGPEFISADLRETLPGCRLAIATPNQVLARRGSTGIFQNPVRRLFRVIRKVFKLGAFFDLRVVLSDIAKP